MTLARRIIPCLDVDAGRVVKGVEFAGLRDMGDPEELAARYNSEGADELILLDITASRDGRATFLETVGRVAQQLNIPFTAGGGIRRLEDGHAVLRAGADKVTVNTAAVERPDLISELAAQFGSQAVVLSMDVKKTNAGWEVVIRGGAESSGRDAAARALVGARGVGEAVGDHYRAPRQRRADGALQVVGARGVHQESLGQRRPAVGRALDQERPDRLGAGRAAGLTRRHHLASGSLQPLGQAADLGGLAGPLPAFETDEKSWAHLAQIVRFAARRKAGRVTRRWPGIRTRPTARRR